MPPLAPPWLASAGQLARFGPAVLARRRDEAVARDARAVAAALAPVAVAREGVPAAVPPPRESTLAQVAVCAAKAPLTALVMAVAAEVGFAAASSAKAVVARAAPEVAWALVVVRVPQPSGARLPAAVIPRPEPRPLGQPETPSRPTPVRGRSAKSRCGPGRAAQPTPPHAWQTNRPAIGEPAPGGCWTSDSAPVLLTNRARRSRPLWPAHLWTEIM
jgi:hypothetical protein